LSSKVDEETVVIKVPKGSIIDVGGLDFVLKSAIKFEGHFTGKESEQNCISNRKVENSK